MRIFYGLLIGLFVAFFELFFVKFLSIKGIIPSLIPVFVLFAAFYGGRRMGLWAGFMAGLIMDFYARYYIGIGIIFYSSVGFVLGNIRNKLLFDSTIGKLLSLLIVNFLQSSILWISSRPESVLNIFMVSILPKILYSTFLGGIILYILLLVFSKISYIAALFRFIKK
ncbi:rod shape-determining protein MreD [candidate division WOR-3 bacterium]|nr:rod shape-determining protein MreD [candidate division WOR-3 bacterium]